MATEQEKAASLDALKIKIDKSVLNLETHIDETEGFSDLEIRELDTLRWILNKVVWE